MTLPSIAVGGVVKSMIAVTVSLHPAAAHHGSRYTTVQPGNTLSSISQRVYGSSADWPALWWINRGSVPNPGRIRAGQRLRLSSWHPVSPWLTHAALTAIPAPRAVTALSAQPATAADVTSATPGSFESCVIQAESGGNAQAVNASSGAGGLYGFLPSTWQALGYSGLPENASASEQNAAFAKEYAQSGTSAWTSYDGC